MGRCLLLHWQSAQQWPQLYQQPLRPSTIAELQDCRGLKCQFVTAGKIWVLNRILLLEALLLGPLLRRRVLPARTLQPLQEQAASHASAYLKVNCVNKMARKIFSRAFL